MPSATHERIADDEALGYTFGDGETRSQMQLLDDLQEIGLSEYIDLPQLVVVGDQSTGKSSVLQAVTRIPFAVDDKMCTRFATEIVLKHTSAQETTTKIQIIPNPRESKRRRQQLVNWKPEVFNSNSTLSKANMQMIFKQAEAIIFDTPMRERLFGSKAVPASSDGTPYIFGGPVQPPTTEEYSSHSDTTPDPDFPVDGQARPSRLSRSILRITRSGPRETNFAIVDVPGLIRGDDTNEEYKTAKALVQNYLQNPRSIVVAVIDIVDLERQEISQMLDEIPDKESRVIGVINKCDTKQKKSHEWVFDLIRNVNQNESPIYLKEGWYGLRNRSASEQDVSDKVRDQNEQSFFTGDEWEALGSSKLGRDNLTKALVRMRNRHIKQSIPELLSEIQNKLVVCNGKISKLGKPLATNHAQFLEINSIAMAYSSKIRSGLEGYYNELEDPVTFSRRHVLQNLDEFERQMLKNGQVHRFRTSKEDGDAIASSDEDEFVEALMEKSTYKWIHDEVQNYRSTADRRRANPQVEAKLWRDQTAKWETLAEYALQQIETTVEETNSAIFEDACGEPHIRAKLMTWLQEDFNNALNDAKKELQRLLEGERQGRLFSFHGLKTKLEQKYRSQRLEKIANFHGGCVVSGSHDEDSDDEEEDEDKDYDEERVVSDAPGTSITQVSNILYGHPELACVLEMHDNLRAYYEIALARFMDNFAIQVVERHLLGPEGPLRLFNSAYVSQKLYGPDNAVLLNELMSEHPETSLQRSAFETEKAKLEAGRRKVQSFKNL